MQIVAIRALHKAFVHTVVERFGKLRFGRGVTLVAKLGLTPREQPMLFLRVVRRMAVQAADIIAGMRRSVEVHLPFAVCVTSQTAGAGLLPGGFLEANDLADVASARHMFAPWTVTGFATMSAL